ncbi:unnamed protein product [Dovyalis caffra]|uniref:Uncharacterized protein n=1 Tax=Dovyalis caffra TaxID=77055 RepID=A0AAV1RNH9_9ROSI|nr:unnamed protein product [Dovyalis caffra]
MRRCLSYGLSRVSVIARASFRLDSGAARGDGLLLEKVVHESGGKPLELVYVQRARRSSGLLELRHTRVYRGVVGLELGVRGRCCKEGVVIYGLYGENDGGCNGLSKERVVMKGFRMRKSCSDGERLPRLVFLLLHPTWLLVLGSGYAKPMADGSIHLAQLVPLDHVEVEDCLSDEDSTFEDASLEGSDPDDNYGSHSKFFKAHSLTPKVVGVRNQPSVEEQVGGKMISRLGKLPQSLLSQLATVGTSYPLAERQ